MACLLQRACGLRIVFSCCGAQHQRQGAESCGHVLFLGRLGSVSPRTASHHCTSHATLGAVDVCACSVGWLRGRHSTIKKKFLRMLIHDVFLFASFMARVRSLVLAARAGLLSVSLKACSCGLILYFIFFIPHSNVDVFILLLLRLTRHSIRCRFCKCTASPASATAAATAAAATSPRCAPLASSSVGSVVIARC